MDEEATFEARAVLAPRRKRTARLVFLVPVVALIVVAWVGVRGAPATHPTTAVVPGPTAVSVPPIAVDPRYPAEVIGLPVQRLGDLQLGSFGFDSVIAIAGWYVPTAISDCPPFAAIYRDGALPYLRGDADKLAFCVRSGMLYPSRPDLRSDGSPDDVPTGVAVEVVVGVVMPRELEAVGTDPTQVVVLGRFGKVNDACSTTGVGCSRELLLDHVAWTPGA
jgi:hypothetical protein